MSRDDIVQAGSGGPDFTPKDWPAPERPDGAYWDGGGRHHPERPDPWHRSEDCHGACHAAMTRQHDPATDAGLLKRAATEVDENYDLTPFSDAWWQQFAAEYAALSQQAEKA
jgi:hypothetical protein